MMMVIVGLIRCEILMTTRRTPSLYIDGPVNGSIYSLKSNINESSIIIKYRLDDIDYIDHDIDYIDESHYCCLEMCINVLRFNSG